MRFTLNTAWAGNVLKYYDVIDSTNDEVKRLADFGAPHGTLVIAERQSGGKGRLGRSWSQEAGTTIAMSLLLYPELPVTKAAGLSLAAALAVCQAIRSCTGLNALIKWPNDIVCNGKKICGILTELRADKDQVRDVVIGIGINVNQLSFEGELAGKATSLYIESGRQFERESLILAVLQHFEACFTEYSKSADMEGLMGAYTACLVNLNRSVRVLDPALEYIGICRGIMPDGSLLVEADTGEVRCICSGEVSVRGIYGYV